MMMMMLFDAEYTSIYSMRLSSSLLICIFRHLWNRYFISLFSLSFMHFSISITLAATYSLLSAYRFFKPFSRFLSLIFYYFFFLSLHLFHSLSLFDCFDMIWFGFFCYAYSTDSGVFLLLNSISSYPFLILYTYTYIQTRAHDEPFRLSILYVHSEK